MKFACDGCGAQYMIADEKIGKAGVKVRCKKCSHVIVVKRPVEEENDQATVVMDNPLAGMESAEAPSFDASADGEIGAAFDSIFGEESEAPQTEAPPSKPSDPFAAAVDDAFDAALDGGPVAEDDSGDLESTRVFSSADMQRVAEEREYAAGPLFDDEPSREAEPEPEDESDGRDWYVAIGDEQVGPLTVEEVQGHWESGDLSPDSLVWRQGLGDWEPLSSIDELKHLIAPAPALGGRQQTPEAFGLEADAPASDAAAPPEEDEQEPTWKPAAASLLASLAAEEMSALERESEEDDELAGPSADPVAEAAPPPPASSFGLEIPEPPPATDDAVDPPPPPAPETPGAQPEQRAPTPAPFEAPVAPAPGPQPAAPPAQQGGYGYGGQPGFAQPTATQAPHYGGYGAGPVTAAPPPPPGMSRRMMLAIGGGGAGVSALLVFLVLMVTGALGGDKPELTEPRPIEPAAGETETDEDKKAGEEEKDEAADSEEGAEEEEADEEEAEPEQAKAAEETPPTAKSTPPRQQQRQTQRRRPRTQQTTTKASTPPRKQASPPPRQTPPPSPPPQRKQSSSDDEDLESQLFGTSSSRPTAGGGRSARRDEEPASGRGYIPPAAGSRDRDLPREVSRGDIMSVVSSKRGELRSCVSRQRAADPGASGRVLMGWRIQPDGTPTAIRVKSSEHAGTVIAQCLTQVIGTMRFPRYGGPPMSEIEFPFDF